MFNNKLDYHASGKTKNFDVSVDLYTFKCMFNQQYIVEVEHHRNNIFVIKYFQKNHKDSKMRYSLMNGETLWKKPENAMNFFAILNTVTQIMLDIYFDIKNASYAFMGAPTKFEISYKNKSNINEDGTIAKTKRYNIYSLYVKRYFSPTLFEHIEIETSSCYLLRNIDNKKITKEKVESFFSNYISDYC